MTQQKYFVIGLPRTGTTSVCVAALNLGFQTAHTVYTKKGLESAEFIADTPIYCDFKELDTQFPGAKFILLTREKSKWLPSIKQLLQRMYVNISRQDGGFHPGLKRSIQTVFEPFTLDNIADDAFLAHCYERHLSNVTRYFSERPADLLTLDVSQPHAYSEFCRFVKKTTLQSGFEVINKGGKVTAWNSIHHPLKVPSTRNGKVDLH